MAEESAAEGAGAEVGAEVGAGDSWTEVSTRGLKRLLAMSTDLRAWMGKGGRYSMVKVSVSIVRYQTEVPSFD